MRKIAFVSAFLAVFMAAAILYALLRGDFAGEGALITSLPWGIVSLVDLYAGFTLFSLWIYYRERSLPIAVLWILSVMTLGFLAASIYVSIAVVRSRGDRSAFFFGSGTPR